MASSSGGKRSIQLSYGRLGGQSSSRVTGAARVRAGSRRLAGVDLSVIFLGTGGSVPSARRSTASVLLARGGDRLLFDCGEGTQRQLQRSLGLIQVDEIFLTHFHADHFLGLPGLLKTYDLTDREEPLTIYGPPRPARPLQDLRPLIGRPRYELDLVELNRARRSPTTAHEVQPFEVAHGVRANGYALIEEERPGRFDPEAAAPRRRRRPGLRGAAARGGGGGQRRPGAPDEVMGRPARPHDRRSPATPRPARRPSPPPPTPSC